MKKIASIAVLLITAFVAQAQKVTFYSSEFENGVRAHLGLGNSGNVQQSQMDTITCLNLSGLDITDIRDAVYLPAVTKLDLSYNGITDVSPLLSLELLSELNLSYNQLDNIDLLAFSQAKSMQVDVTNNYIGDFSYFYTPTNCDFTFMGMGMQMKKEESYLDVYQLYADINDKGQAVITYRGYTNETSTQLKYGSSSIDAELDGNTHQITIDKKITKTTKVTLSNSVKSEKTYIVPHAKYYVGAGKTKTMKTGLLDGYSIVNAYAELGKVEINDRALNYIAPAEEKKDIVYFSYYEGNTLKGFSRYTINDGEAVSMTISDIKHLAYVSDKDLDFKDVPDLKAYVATGYDKDIETVWLTQVYDVPAETGFLVMGEAGTYDIPVLAGGSTSYYKNMFHYTLEGKTLMPTDGECSNYIMADGDDGVGFYKVKDPNGISLVHNRAYLSLPTIVQSSGTTGGTETIKVGSSGLKPYFCEQSLDFSELKIKGVKAYTATGYDKGSGTVWLTQVEQVPAETGILIMARKGTYDVPTASVSTIYENMFNGSLTASTIGKTETINDVDYANFYLSSGDLGDGFYKVTENAGVSLDANRSYLQIPSSVVDSDQLYIAITEADEVIGIQIKSGEAVDIVSPVSPKNDSESVYYNLLGQRVINLGKGIYIKNGKKVLIK